MLGLRERYRDWVEESEDMKPLTYLKALAGIDDVNAFWRAREEILSSPKKHAADIFLCKKIRKRYGAGIPINKAINEFFAPHGFNGIFISKDAEIGSDCTILQQVTIGINFSGGGAPKIGQKCLIGAGAKIIGNVRVGKNVRIGANAIVVEDIPDNCTVVMNKPRVIQR